ncbi:MAG TPA: DinB family protein [Chloroflexota bacterium]|jgi:uncharacterized damage-inducible protein DinB
MTSSVLPELLRHKTWATLQLIEFCQRLAPEHLDATVPGTYGSVRETLRHLLESDAGYLRRVTGEDIPPLPPETGLGARAERFRTHAKRWEQLFQDQALPARELTGPRGSMEAVAPMAQSIHHADDHRTQVLTILGARGIAVPDLDIWMFGTEMGFVRPSEAAPA